MPPMPLADRGGTKPTRTEDCESIMQTLHATERIAERLSPAESTILAHAIDRLARTMPDSRAYAVLVARVPVARGTFVIHPDGTGPSNGTDLYAIIRNRSIVTVMWRRTAQPTDAASFRVDVVGKVALR